MAAGLASLLVGACLSAQGAVFVLEEFGSDPSWVDRDVGVDMVLAWNSGFGNPAGSMQGSFAAQGTPFAETDAMRINSTSSGGQFSGNLLGTYGGLGFDLDTGYFEFRFYSDTVIPSDLRFRINGNGSTFSRSVLSQAPSVGGWQTITVDLSWGGWLGGTEAQYQNVFSAVNFIDIQITRSGTGAQNFYVDNFGLGWGELVNPGDSAVPEAATAQFLLVGVLFLAGGFRRRIRKMASRLEA